ncbi:MAG TPA: diacylglycerol kinase family protein [Nocardioidaceae bacterium]|nr:diacylglycerol kinase family protein [Nocardioidaceae bacterium]
MDSFLLITNSEAGSNDSEQVDKALAVLREAADVEVCATSNQGELDGVLHRRGGRRVIVAGGDGSLHAVIAALHRRHELHDVVIGLIPLGTGNDFARGSEIPLDPEEAARLVLKGDVRPVDLIIDCAGEVVVNNVHVGLGAEASRKAHKWKKRLGRLGYGIGAALSSVNPPFVRLRVEVDGHVVADFDRPILQVSIGNGSDVGGGTHLAPDADAEDGRLDLMVSYAIGPFARFGYAWGLSRGRHHERDDVLYVRGSTVSVSGQAFYCSADGELYGPERNRTWRVEGHAYSMILPH